MVFYFGYQLAYMLKHIVLGFLFVCISVLHSVAFRFVYSFACRDSVDWFEITSNDMFVRQNSFHDFE